MPSRTLKTLLALQSLASHTLCSTRHCFHKLLSREGNRLQAHHHQHHPALQNSTALSTLPGYSPPQPTSTNLRADKAFLRWFETHIMDGRNCNGRKISLLNDSSCDVAALPPTKIQLPPLTAHSRASSSCESTPSLSPQTPRLSRSTSSDSRGGFATPSPLTPSYNSFESGATDSARQHYYIASHSYAKMDDQSVQMYPPIPDAAVAMPSAYPLPPQLQQQIPQQAAQPIQRLSASPSSEPSRVSTVSATSNPKAQAKKNQYPCPMAKQMGCTDFFTTSGHAARHAKKHTGKKDAFCPECNKAFTRKDNMEQHRRTHQNGRTATKSNNSNNTNSEEAKVKKPTKAPARKSTIKAEPQQFEAAVEQMLADQQQPVIQIPVTQQLAQAQQVQAVQQMAAMEQAMMLPPAGPYFLPVVDSGPVPALPLAVQDLNMRPPLHRSNLATSIDYIPPVAPMMADPDLHYSYPSPGLSHGLNSLALAASEHRRLSEEKTQSRSPQDSSSQGTPTQETPSQESP